MHIRRVVQSVLSVTALVVGLGGLHVQAQDVRIEAGGGWGVPSSEVTTVGTVDGGDRVGALVNPGSGPHAYGAVGLVWTLTDDLALEGRVRAQQSRLRVNSGDVRSGVCGRGCRYLTDLGGRLWAGTLEGQLTLTSVGRINPYFLVGLGVVRTTVDAFRTQTASNQTAQFSEVSVTDAGGDIGFGATTQLSGGLRLTAETRVTGSLPGAKENAITVFPFSMGLSYEF